MRAVADDLLRLRDIELSAAESQDFRSSYASYHRGHAHRCEQAYGMIAAALREPVATDEEGTL